MQECHNNRGLGNEKLWRHMGQKDWAFPRLRRMAGFYEYGAEPTGFNQVPMF
jgi:hypothetical protein